MNTIPNFEQESTDLKLHVDLCAQRYKELDERLSRLDDKMDQIVAKLELFRGDFFKVLVTTGGTILVAILGLIAAYVK